MQHRLDWRQPTPLMQLTAFVMRLDGEAHRPSLDEKGLRRAIEDRAQELREMLPYIRGKKPWVDINGLKPEDECPNCHCGTLGYENHRLVCRGECGTDFSPQ